MHYTHYDDVYSYTSEAGLYLKHAVLKFHPVFNLQSYVMLKEVKSYHVQFCTFCRIFLLRKLRSLIFLLYSFGNIYCAFKVGNMVLDLALNIHPESCQFVLIKL